MSNDAMLKRAKEVVVDFYVGREMEYDKTTTGQSLIIAEQELIIAEQALVIAGQKLVSIALGFWSNPMVCK